MQWILAIFAGFTFVALILAALGARQFGILQGQEAARLRALVAEANRKAAEANEKAEAERLARVRIEERLAPRNLTPDRLEPFLAILRRGPSGPVDIQFIGNDNEASTFAAQIRDALRRAGWDAHITAAVVSIEGSQGLIIHVRDVSHPPAQAEILKNAFRQIGFPVSDGPPDASLPEGTVRLFVGQKP